MKEFEMRKSKARTVVGFVLICFMAVSALAEVRLPSIIGSDMVLQQNSSVAIWGWAKAGEKVTVRGSWQELFGANTRADENGKWMVKLKTPKAGGPYSLTVKGENTIKLKNILIGQVWLCSGQSNMRWPVMGSNNSQQEIAAADYPNIRLFTVERQTSNVPVADCNGLWTVCSPKTVGNFSAVAYFFGRELHKQLDVPVGLVLSAWGGSTVEAWTAKEYFKGIPNIDVVLDRWEQSRKNYNHQAAIAQYEKALKQWKVKAKQARSEGRKIPYQPAMLKHPLKSQQYPSNLYNAMLMPLAPFAIKGAIWYQGEANSHVIVPELYKGQLTAMINNWRQLWGQGDFGFYFVQLPNFKSAQKQPSETIGKGSHKGWVIVREDLLKTLLVPNTGMAVTIDVGNPEDIHPKNKQPVGRRLALLALANSYDRDIVYSGPIYKSMQVKDDKVVLRFEHVGSGLVAKDGELKTFAIAGADKKFVWANAQIVGDTVQVSCGQVARPAAVRYAWAANPIECNLYNKEGLPASPFRTDNWPIESE